MTLAEAALLVLAFLCWATVAWCMWMMLRRPKDDQPIVRRGDVPAELPPAPGVPDSVPDWMMQEKR